MLDERPIYETDESDLLPDPDEVPIRDRRLSTQPYDLVVKSLFDQIANGTIFLRPISERPSFQRRYVWTNILASRLIESILLNVPIPPCYLSQNEEFELDVIDGQQRLFSIYRFLDNRFSLEGLEGGLREPPDVFDRVPDADALDRHPFGGHGHLREVEPETFLGEVQLERASFPVVKRKHGVASVA